MTRPAPTVTVPVEPTEAMWAAGERAFDRDPDLHHETVVANIWSAMLAAAPAAPQAAGVGEAGPAEREVGRAVYERIERLIDTDPRGAELDYLSHLTESVEEVGGYDGPLTPLRAPSREPEGGAVSYAAWDVVRRVANLTVAGDDPLQDPAFAKYPAIADLVCKAQSALATREKAPAEAGVVTDRMVTEALKERFTPERYARDYEYIEANYHGSTRRQLVAALRAQPQAREDAQPVDWPEAWSGPCNVGNMISNLRTLPPEMPLYSAYHVSMGDKPSLLKVKRPTLSRERVDGNDIKTGDESVPYSAVIWTEPRDFTEATHPAPDALRVAVELLAAAKDNHDPEAVYIIAMEALAALQAEQKGGA